MYYRKTDLNPKRIYFLKPFLVCCCCTVVIIPSSMQNEAIIESSHKCKHGASAMYSSQPKKTFDVLACSISGKEGGVQWKEIGGTENTPLVSMPSVPTILKKNN